MIKTQMMIAMMMTATMTMKMTTEVNALSWISEPCTR